MKDKGAHLTLSERIIIETGISKGASKVSIAKTIGKDKSTITKEIKNHRKLKSMYTYPIDCSNYQKCKDKNTYLCNLNCSNYTKFTCSHRDRSPGACNGCNTYRTCHYQKYYYKAENAHNDYKDNLVNCRAGVNATVEQIKTLGNLIKPLLDNGQSLYAIKASHDEIKVSEQTLYNYVEDGVFKDAGVNITCLDLKRQVSRKISKKSKVRYAPRKDRTYLKGRVYKDFEEYLTNKPYANIVEMDTVYNDVSNGSFIQTFKFLRYDLLFCVYHTEKTAQEMLNGVLLLEKILGEELFSKEVEVLKTDRGSEFTLANETETRNDGTLRTRIFYCDSMASYQKGSLENIHHLVRDICPKNYDLHSLGLDSQEKANRISININSYPKEKLKGKTAFQLVQFYSEELANKLFTYGLKPIKPEQVVLKPSVLK